MLEIFSECVIVIVIVKLAVKEEWREYVRDVETGLGLRADEGDAKASHVLEKRRDGSHRCAGGHRLERCVAQDDRMIILVQALWYFEVWHTIVALCRMSQAFGGKEVE